MPTSETAGPSFDVVLVRDDLVLQRAMLASHRAAIDLAVELAITTMQEGKSSSLHQPVVDLWKTREGLRCTITPAAADPPFEVTVLIGDKPIRRVAFMRHDDAIAFAIMTMHEALPTLTDLTDNPEL